MSHDLNLIFTLTYALIAALFMGLLAQKIKLSPIVGYLVAGMLVGPHTPGFVADDSLARQMAEIGVILLMFGVGLEFHFHELLAVKYVAIPGALIQVLSATIMGVIGYQFIGWNWQAGLIFGLAISVASTVVLIRLLTEHHALHQTSGHIAIGWLVVEDLLTVIALVVLPTLSGEAQTQEPLVWVLGIILLKLVVMAGLIVAIGRWILPRLLKLIADSGSDELFTLAILSIALGLAVGGERLFGASMALGAFLAGLVLGQSHFASRAAKETLPFRDIFAVIFFVSVGMLLNPVELFSEIPALLLTLVIILVGKPLSALVVVRVLGQPLSIGLTVGVALAQIGEFSFILATLGTELHLLPSTALNILVAASILSIIINPFLYRGISKLGQTAPLEPD